MNYTRDEVLQYIEENDVKFIKLFFTDIFGTIKSISIQPGELERAFDTGISFDASALKGFLNVQESDLFLVPDPATLSILPWRPQHGRVVRFFCSIKYPDGRFFEGDTRHILEETAEKAEKLGYKIKAGTDCEFYLLKNDENGEPTKIPLDHAGYCDLAPKDKGENVRRNICLTLEQMGIPPESSHHEDGPGQQEVDFKNSSLLPAADNFATFKTVVETVAASNGLHASFLPKPLENETGSGLHINLTLLKNSRNIFLGDKLTDEASWFTAGIISHIKEITAFLNPLESSYKRLGSFDAPRYITWSRHNRGQLIRIPAAADSMKRLELRSPDPSCNQYLAFALLVNAGLDGIEKKMPLQNEVNKNLFEEKLSEMKGIDKLPSSYEDAKAVALESDFVKKVLPSVSLAWFRSSLDFANGDAIQ
jgi:glutamine synthetase